MTQPSETPEQVALAQTEYAQSGFDHCSALPCTDEAEYNVVTHFLSAGRKDKATLEALKKTITGPLWQAHKAASALFKKPLDLWDQIDKVLNEKAVAYVQAEARKKEAAVKEAAKVGPDEIQAAALAPTPTSSSMTTSSTWTYTVESHADIPEPYGQWVADHEKIKAAVKAGVRDIPGVKIFEKTTMRRR